MYHEIIGYIGTLILCAVILIVCIVNKTPRQEEVVIALGLITLTQAIITLTTILLEERAEVKQAQRKVNQRKDVPF